MKTPFRDYLLRLTLAAGPRRLLRRFFPAEETPVAAEPSKMRCVKSLGELDAILKELDAALAVSDDELRRVFKTFHMEFPLELPADPYSETYRRRQFELYEFLAGKPYSPGNEVSEFDVDRAASRPFPFHTESPATVGNHLIAIGHLIRTLNLPAGASVLEFGPGWGNTTVWLARMGYRVTAVDIEKRFVDLIAERARRKQLEIEAIQGDFQMVQTTDRRWDAVLFFESFHHCADHHALVQRLEKIVNPGGKVIFAAEPITDDFPIPWGFRLDGESLWAIRNFGWCELGFQESYFTDLMGRHGWALEKHSCAETPWGTIFVATRDAVKIPLIYPASQLPSQVGRLEGTRLIAAPATNACGFLCYGPYVALPRGKYVATINYSSDASETSVIGECDVVASGGERIIAKREARGTAGSVGHSQLVFELSQPVKDLEVRFLFQGLAKVELMSIEISRADIREPASETRSFA